MTHAALRTFRKRLGLTQAEAASRLGMSDRQWQRWESGEAPIPAAVTLAVGYVTLTGQWAFPPIMPAE
jgi:transcriptional regulator with XRE-family HTH domain